MGDLHQLVLTHGKQAALELHPEQKALILKVSDYLADDAQERNYVYSGWSQVTLPHSQLKDRQEMWTVGEDGPVQLTIQPDRKLITTGVYEYCGVPFGARARMLLIYLQTRAVEKQSREVPVGNNLRQWCQKMGISPGGKTYAQVIDQCDRLFHCSVTFRHTSVETQLSILERQLILDRAAYTMGKAGRPVLSGAVWLAEKYYNALCVHRVPLEEAALCQLSTSSLALDIYVWLAYRLHHISAPVDVSWPSLKGQFGKSFTDIRMFRRFFAERLHVVLQMYPDARVEVSRFGLRLHHSNPPVRKVQVQVLEGKAG